MQNLTELHEALASVVLAERQLGDVLTEITGIARRAMPSIEAASVTLIRGEKPFTAAYDGQMALDADELQYERGYGPCMDAGRAAQVFLVDDMRSEQRWPDYAQHAAAHGVLSSLSVPLPFQGATIGALNTYAGRPRVIDDNDVELATEVAAWVAIAIRNAEAAARTSEDLTQLRTAMMSRACIEQAKGILMERHKIKRERGIHHPDPRLPTNQHQAARRGRRAGPDRCGAQSRLTHNSRRPFGLSSRRHQATPIGAPSIRRHADRRIDRSLSPWNANPTVLAALAAKIPRVSPRTLRP